MRCSSGWTSTAGMSFNSWLITDGFWNRSTLFLALPWSHRLWSAKTPAAQAPHWLWCSRMLLISIRFLTPGQQYRTCVLDQASSNPGLIFWASSAILIGYSAMWAWKEIRWTIWNLKTSRPAGLYSGFLVMLEDSFLIINFILNIICVGVRKIKI